MTEDLAARPVAEKAEPIWPDTYEAPKVAPLGTVWDRVEGTGGTLLDVDLTAATV